MLTMSPTKNWNVVASSFDTSVEPYQKTRAIAKNVRDWEIAYNMLLQIAVLLEFLKGTSKLSLYCCKQSSSRVNDATVRMDPAASQAK